MEDKKYQIFVSSTFIDLKDVRDKLFKTILNLYHLPVGMEMFSAGDSDQWEIITDTIDMSDYYILVIGHRYGTAAADGISYTEKEYDYAIEHGIPVLAFIRNRDIATSETERDSDPKLLAKLNKFIKKAKTGKMCEFWDTPDELSTKVAVALPKTFKKIPRIGWVRGFDDKSKETLAELTLLSIENRKLREDLANQQERRTQEEPALEVILNDTQKLVLEGRKPEHTGSVLLPPKATLQDFSESIRKYLTTEDIETYNNGIPTEEIAYEYLKELHRYECINEACIPLTLTIINKGNSKASAVTITLTFPSFVEIIFESKSTTSLPPKDILPTPLIQIARQRSSNIHNAPTEGYNSREIFLTDDLEREKIPERKPSSTYNLSLNENILSIYLNGLMGSANTTFGSHDLVIVPLRKGEGYIDVVMTCDQYSAEDFFQIPIAVRY